MNHPVFGQTVRGDACERLRNELEDGAKFLKKHKVPPMIHSEMYFGLAELWRIGKTTTILKESMDIYRKCGFEVTEQGIGWSIS
jgi:hypothetical protein